jgi:hypothetical protein
MASMLMVFLLVIIRFPGAAVDTILAIRLLGKWDKGASVLAGVAINADFL